MFQALSKLVLKLVPATGDTSISQLAANNPSKTAFQLGPEQETLFIPLIARAYETRREDRQLEDQKALQIVKGTDYDYTKFPNSFALRGAVGRTLLLDADVKSYMSEYPEGVVVEVGCGMNTHFERVDNGRIHWFDLDLPDVIDMRRQFFTDTDRRHMIAASFTDDSWYAQVKKALPADGNNNNSKTPICFVCEASIIYIDADIVRKGIVSIADAFDHVVFITDTAGTTMADGQSTHPLMKNMREENYVVWKCDDPAEIERWVGARWKLVQSRTMMALPDAFHAEAPFVFRFMKRFLPSVADRFVGFYKMNVFKSVHIIK